MPAANKPNATETVAAKRIRFRGRPLAFSFLVVGLLFTSTRALHAQTAPSGTVITIAGNGAFGFSGDGGPALSASFRYPSNLAIGPDGTLYVSDSSNFRIRAINPVTGIITTVAFNGSIVGDNGPADNNGDGGPATSASCAGIYGIDLDPARNVLYVADQGNDRVRQVNLATGIISKFAGASLFYPFQQLGMNGDGGPAVQAWFAPAVFGVALGPNHDVYITSGCRLRKVDGATNIIQTLAGHGDSATLNSSDFCGPGGDGGLASAATFSNPSSLRLDAAGNVFIVDDFAVIRRIDAATGIIARFAGGGTTIPGSGPALAMNLGGVGDIAVSGAGPLFIANVSQIFQVDLTTSELTPFAGDATAGFSGDGGPALSARFLMGNDGLIVPPGGGLIVSDSGNQRIRYIAPDSINLSGDTQQTAFYLPWVSALTGDLIISNNPNLTIVSAASLTSVGGTVNVTGNSATGNVDLGSLMSAGGAVNVTGNSATGSVDLSSLMSAGGTVTVAGTTATGNVDLGSLMSAGGAVNVTGNSATGNVDLSSLMSAGGTVNVTGNSVTGSVDLSSLMSAGGSVNVTGNSATGSVDLSSLISVGGGGGARSDTADSGSGGSLDISGNLAATTIDLRLLTTVVGNITIASNAPNVSVNLNSLANVGDGINPATINLNGGTFTFASGLTVAPLVSLTGQGTLSGNVTNSGVIAPGASPGRFDIAGNLVLASGSQLRMELGGTAPGTQFDFVAVAGSTTLGGTLAVNLINNFQSVMTSGASFTILTSGSPITGAFTNVASGGTLTTTDGYARFTVNYAGANSVQLSGLVIVDSDGDGIPDWWEDQFGLNKNSAADATLDSDGDGMSNLAEFLAGTDPNNSASAFRVTLLAPAGANAMTITWQSAAGKNYTVERSLDLQFFSTVSGTVAATGSQTSFTDSAVPAGATKVFYRVRLAP